MKYPADRFLVRWKSKALARALQLQATRQGLSRNKLVNKYVEEGIDRSRRDFTLG
jgi:predicted HicB family RNase H-like nuclease